YAALEVSDDGPGVPAHDAARLFEPLYTTKAPGSGSGMGLSIVADMANDVGGGVLGDRGPAGGARFTVLMPIAPKLTPSKYAIRAPRRRCGWPRRAGRAPRRRAAWPAGRELPATRAPGAQALPTSCGKATPRAHRALSGHWCAA